MSYRIYANNIDISASVEKNTVKINEQLNNRSNMCNFGVLENNIDASTAIKVYEYFEIVEQANSGQAVLKVSDTYDYYDVFVAGNEILLDFEGPLRQYVTILSVDHDTKEITLTSNLTVNIPAGTYGGRLVFAGTTERNPDDQLGYTTTFSYKVTVADWKPTFDRKVVVETYADQYMREIIGRIIYQFMANDAEVTLEDFEAAWTQGGVGLVMQDNGDDRIFGQRSQETGTTGAGTATWTKTLAAPVDISTMTDVRLWHKTIEDEGSKVDSLIYRVGSDSSNYMERSSVWVGVDNEQCWNYENFKIDRATIVGSPDLEDIERLQIEVEANDEIPQGSIRFDLSQATLGGFMLKNVFRGDTPFVDFRKQYEKPSTVIEDICKLQGIFWFIDYNRDLHVFRQNTVPAPFGLDNSTLNRGDMSLTVDISMLRNRQTVRGGEAPATSRLVQDQRTDGVKETRELSYKPKDLDIYVAYQDIPITGATWLANVATFTTGVNHGYIVGDKVAVTDMDPNQYSGSYIITDVPTADTFEVDLVTGTPPGTFVAGGFVGEFQAKTVGVENLVDATTVDYVFNFQEKVIRRGADDILPDGAVIRADYFPYQAIRVRVKNQPSIDALILIAGGDGIFDGEVIEDASILTFEEARRRAQAEVNAYGNPIINIKFQTNKAGLHAGQVIHITDINRGIDDDYLIQKVSRRSKEGARSEYQVECASTMFGIIEFFQLLLKKSRRSVVDLSELVDIVVNQDETITITPSMQFFQKENEVTAASTMAAKWWDFISNLGSTNTSGVIPHPDGTTNNMRKSFMTDAAFIGELFSTNLQYYNKGIDEDDYSGNAYNGTISGAVTFGSDADGDYIKFDGDRNNGAGTGTIASVVIGNVMNFDEDDDFSWFCKARVESLPPNGSSGLFGSDEDIVVAFSASGIVTFVIHSSTGGYTTTSTVLGSNWLASRLGEVHIYSLKYIGSEKKMYCYIDGILLNATPPTLTGALLTDAWAIGDDAIGALISSNKSSSEKYVYECRVYNKAFTDEEFDFISKMMMGDPSAGEDIDAEVGFATGGRYNTGKELYIDITSYTGGSLGKYAEAHLSSRLEANGSTDYRISAWLQNLESDGLVGGEGCTIEILEYDAKIVGELLATTPLFSGATAYHDWKNYSDEFTTHADTTHIDIVIRVDESVGKISVGDILLEELATEAESNPGIASYSEAT